VNTWRAGAVAAALAVVLAQAGPAAAAPNTDRAWRSLLDRAAQAAEKTAYVGESLWVTYENGQASISTFLVRSSGDGEISVADQGRFAVRLGNDGGSLADHERNWFFPLPAADLAKAHKGLDRLAAKYDVEVLPSEPLLDRPCSRLQILRESDGELVERLWIDDASGLLLRRETFDGADNPLRMVAYLKLDLRPKGRDVSVRPTRGQRPSQQRQQQEVTEVDPVGRAALRDAGWTLPDDLPGEFVTEGSFVVQAGQSQPLQTVYSDGLYTVSLFEQPGSLDTDALPEGAQLNEAYGFPAYVWPGAVPTRVVWEAGGTTWSLVGDAPPDEMAAMLASLPQPQREGFTDRIRRGLGRLWSWVSPWS
jgi:sigma-E factor negative regulatory protein RseB